ncbi:MAG: leucine-rich repeat domain-containing protein [Candidatus Heimdallarchaeaceae archaeon]
MKIKLNTTKGEKEFSIKKSHHVIDLSNMNLMTINLDFLKDLPNVEAINLSSNNLSRLDLTPLENCSNLTSLRLSNNNLTKIRLEPLRNCLNLEILDLSSNKITEINLSPLISCTMIKSLNLSFNKLETIDLSPLSLFPNLRTLNISNNSLTSINLKKIVFCVALKELDISNNNFRSLDLTPIFGFRNLVRLYISEKEKKVADWDVSYLKYQQLSSGLRYYFQEIKKQKLKVQRNEIFKKILEKYISIKLSKLAIFLGFDELMNLEKWILGLNLKNVTIKGNYMLIDQSIYIDIDKEMDRLMQKFDGLNR